jgi:hypothetical protein
MAGVSHNDAIRAGNDIRKIEFSFPIGLSVLYRLTASGSHTQFHIRLRDWRPATFFNNDSLDVCGWLLGQSPCISHTKKQQKNQ